MKHFCIICWDKWACGIGKGKPKCTGRYQIMCDNCLINIPIRQYKNLPPRELFQ